jgi:hypothetical protein
MIHLTGSKNGGGWDWGMGLGDGTGGWDWGLGLATVGLV